MLTVSKINFFLFTGKIIFMFLNYRIDFILIPILIVGKVAVAKGECSETRMPFG